jgi:RNA polymerase sigma-70 factor (ECF subfamily)
VSVTEGELLDALRARQPQECERFVDAHYRGVYRFFLWLTRHKEVAEDLTQEAYAAFWQSLDRSDPAGIPDVRVWLYGIARNRWRKWCRDVPPPAVELDEALDLPDVAPSPEAQALVTLEGEAVAHAVAALPSDLREALVLRVFEDLSYRQIAAALSIGEALARWRVHRARVSLRAALEPRTEKEKSGAPSP